MFRQFTAIFIALTLCFTTVSCGTSSSKVTQPQQPTTNSSPAAVNNTPLIASGRYPVQQASYDDADGTYTLILLNTPAGTPPQYQVTNLQMARLTDEQIAKGEKSYLEVDGDTQVLYLTEDFKIEYVHNVTETKENPQTGQTETVVVRQPSSFWSPFAGALAGQAIGSLLFRPQYYVPPVYQPGGMRGFGGYGNTYSGAVDRYRSNYNAPPAAVKNREVFRTTGGLRRTPSTGVRQPAPSSGTKSTGSGYGTNRLRTSPQPSARPRSGFGTSSGSRRAPSRSFGGRRR